MAKAWQEHGKNMKEHPKSITRAWRAYGKSMARAWQEHGKSIARTQQKRGKNMARTWQKYCIRGKCIAIAWQ